MPGPGGTGPEVMVGGEPSGTARAAGGITLGVEEEFVLLDPSVGTAVLAGPDLVRMLGGEPGVQQELRACQFFCVSWGSRCPFVILLWIFSGVRVRRGRGRETRRRMNSWLLSSPGFRFPAFLFREPARRRRCGAR